MYSWREPRWRRWMQMAGGWSMLVKAMWCPMECVDSDSWWYVDEYRPNWVELRVLSNVKICERMRRWGFHVVTSSFFDASKSLYGSVISPIHLLSSSWASSFFVSFLLIVIGLCRYAHGTILDSIEINLFINIFLYRIAKIKPSEIHIQSFLSFF